MLNLMEKFKEINSDLDNFVYDALQHYVDTNIKKSIALLTQAKYTFNKNVDAVISNNKTIEKFDSIVPDFFRISLKIYTYLFEIEIRNYTSITDVPTSIWKDIRTEIYYFKDKLNQSNMCNSFVSNELLKLYFFDGIAQYYAGEYLEAIEIFKQGKLFKNNYSEDIYIPLIGSLTLDDTWSFWLNEIETKKTIMKPTNTIYDSNPVAPLPSTYSKDWDAIGKMIEEDIKKEEEDLCKEGGDYAFQRLLQNIYQNSDDETRRAMMKSYETSGGTVLSTNWEEVSKTDYTQNNKYS